MKVNSIIAGKATRRIGNVVMATYGGETIARQYNPDVTNPNTEAQQDTRARFKLMSQLGSIVAPVIAIRKSGLVSARNKFTSRNFPLTSFANGAAQIALSSVQITESNRNFVGFNADRSGNDLVVKLDANGAELYDRVVYSAFQKSSNGELSYYNEIVVSEAGANGLFQGTMTKTMNSLVIYAYGVKANSSKMKSKFENMVAPSAEKIARLIVSSAENYSDTMTTVTAGLTLNAGQNAANSGSGITVQHVLVNNIDIVNGIPSGSTFNAGTLQVEVSITGELETSAQVMIYQVDPAAIIAQKDFLTNTVDISGTVTADNRYIIIVKIPGQPTYYAPSFAVTEE